MSSIDVGGIACDIHPAVPNLKALHPYLSDHWRDIIVQQGMQLITQPMEELANRARARRDRLDRLGPAALRNGLSALGFRRPLPDRQPRLGRAGTSNTE